MIFTELFRTAVLPTLCAAAIAFLGAGLMAREHRAKDIWLGLGLAVGFACGFLAIIGRVPFPPIHTTHWLLWLALGAWIVFTLINLRGHALALGGGLLALVGLVSILLKPFFDRWPTPTIVAWVGGLALCLFLLLLVLRMATAPKDSSPSFWIFIIAATGASMIHVLDGGALSGQLGGVLAASCGGLFLASCFTQGLRMGFVSAGVFTTLFGSALIQGHFYVEVFPLAIILVALSPLAAIWHRVPLFLNWSKGKQFVVSVVTALVPVLIAIGLIIARASDDPYAGY